MIGVALAQAAPAGGPAGSPFGMMVPFVLIFIVFYFLLIRPQQQKQREHQALIDNLKVNDDVLTSGGIYGKVTALNENIVTLEVAPNVRIRVDRAQIASITALPAKTKDKEKDKQK